MSENFKPIEVALNNGFIEETSSGVSKLIEEVNSPVKVHAYLCYPNRERQCSLSISKISRLGTTPGELRPLVDMSFELDKAGNLRRFVDLSRGNTRVWVALKGFTSTDPYFCASYVLERNSPPLARIFRVDACTRERTLTGSREVILRSEIAESEIIKALKATGLPMVIDLLKTLRMYTEGRYEVGGQIIPVTIDKIAKHPVIPADL